MFRKLTTVLAAAAVIFAMLPAVAASAAAGTAALTSARNIFPSTAAQPFSITVTNDESTGNLLGLGRGDSIKFVLINVPANLPTASCPTAPTGWTCRAVNRTGRAPQVFFEATGDGLAPGASLAFPFTATVAKPNAVQRDGVFDVLVGASATDGEKASGSNLTVTVRGLELVPGIGLVADRTVAQEDRFTSGQVFDAIATYTNRSEVPITVTAVLDDSNGPYTIGEPTYAGGTSEGSNVVAPGATLTATFRVTTSGITNGRDVRDFIASGDGAATGSDGPAVLAGGDAVEETRRQITIEAPAVLDLGDASSVRVNGNMTRLVPNGSVEITIDASKTQFPGVDLAALAEDGSGSSIRIYESGCTTCTGITATLAKVSENGTDLGRVLPRSDNANARNLRMHYVVDLADLAAEGNRLELDADFTFEGTDDNGFAFDFAETIADLLVIDLAAPILYLDAPVGDVIADRVSDGSQVTVSGSVEHTGDLESLEVQLAASQAGSDQVKWEETVVTQDDLGADTCTETERVCQDFSVTVTLPGTANADSEDVYALGFGGLVSQSGSVSDTAGNSTTGLPALDANGFAVRQAVSVDNDHPDIVPTIVTPVDGGPALVEPLGYYISESAYNNGGPAVRVTWDAGSFFDIVAGGCNENMWTVDGVSVTDVLFYDGTPCTAGSSPEAGADAPPGANVNDRILVLNGPINPANTVNFSYEADGGALGGLLRDPVADALSNQAYQQDGRVIDGRIPNLPIIDSLGVTRLDLTAGDGSREPAGMDLDDNGTPAESADDTRRFHTNVNDLQVPVTNFIGGIDSLQVIDTTKAEGTAGYEVARIASQQGQEQFDLTQAEIGLLTCSDQCLSERGFRFVRRVPIGNGEVRELFGPVLDAQFVFDLVQLTARRATLQAAGSESTMTVDFAEGAFGSNKVADNFYGSQFEWSLLRTVTGGGTEDAIYARHDATSVSHTREQVSVGIDYGDQDPADFHAGAYEKFFFGNEYLIEDLAGNLMAEAYEITPNGTLTVYEAAQ